MLHSFQAAEESVLFHAKFQHGTILMFNRHELVGTRQSAPAAILTGQKSENSDRIKSRPLAKSTRRRRRGNRVARRIAANIARLPAVLRK
jgi:hypothetical protein